MKDEGDVYRRLQKHLDELPIGFPATESGVELRILRTLFTPEEAEVALGLNALPETALTIQPPPARPHDGGARADPRWPGREGSHLRRPRVRARRGPGATPGPPS